MTERALEPLQTATAVPGRAVSAPVARSLVALPAAGHELSVVAGRRAPAAQGEIELGRTDDPQEREADLVAEWVMGISAPRPVRRTCECAGAPGPDGECAACRAAGLALQRSAEGAAGPTLAPPIVHRVLGSPGAPLDGATLAFFEPRLGTDLSDVRVHHDARAAASAEAVGAAAYVVGSDVVFGEGRHAPGSTSGRRLLAHELAHVLQQRGEDAAGRVVRRTPETPAGGLQAGETIMIEVAPLAGEPPHPRYSGSYPVGARGTVVFDDGENRVEVAVAGLDAAQAAQHIADRLVAELLFRTPTVTVAATGGSATASATAAPAPVVDPAAAPAASDHEAQLSRFLAFMGERARAAGLEEPAERAQTAEALRRMQEWLERNEDTAALLRSEPETVYAEIWVEVVVPSSEAARHTVTAPAGVGANPADAAQRWGKWEEFWALAMDLWGRSGRDYPYVIPLDPQGQDIVVTGDPALQIVNDQIAGDLMTWADARMSDPDFLATDPRHVLADLLTVGGYGQLLERATADPPTWTLIDRNELLPEQVLIAFGENVALGVGLTVMLGFFVGAGVIPVLVAAGFVVGLAAWAGLASLSARHSEVEAGGYEVSVPEQLIYSAGDVIGVSQVIEAYTGERLGTGADMGSQARSEATGVALGNAVTFLAGTRGYRHAEAIGAGYRPATVIRLPEGPEGRITGKLVPDPAPLPEPPTTTVEPGRVEADMRARIREDLLGGFDLWIAEARANGANIETMLASLSLEKVQGAATKKAKAYATQVAKSERAGRLYERSRDFPLRPVLAFNEKIEGHNVWLHYQTEKLRPSADEIYHAEEISRRTGQEVHVFGDTTTGTNYPGIDGTIGSPALLEPLSMKTLQPESTVARARYHTEQALVAARAQGYSHVRVEVLLTSRDVAEVQALWDVVGPGRPANASAELQPVYDGDIVHSVTIMCRDGVWSPPRSVPPLSGPMPLGAPVIVPGTAVPTPASEPEREQP